MAGINFCLFSPQILRIWILCFFFFFFKLTNFWTSVLAFNSKTKQIHNGKQHHSISSLQWHKTIKSVNLILTPKCHASVSLFTFSARRPPIHWSERFQQLILFSSIDRWLDMQTSQRCPTVQSSVSSVTRARVVTRQLWMTVVH